MFDEPDFAIVWPPDLLADELTANQNLADDHGYEGLKKLLQEAFAGDAILDRMLNGEFPEDWNPLIMGGGTLGDATRVSGFQSRLIRAARDGELVPAQQLAPRYRERNAQGQPTGPATAPVDSRRELRRGFELLVRQMDADGYFDHRAPTVCVDDYEQFDFGLDEAVYEELGSYIDLSFLFRYNDRDAADRPIPDSANPAISELSDDVFFELVEVMHDLSARPRRAWIHDHGGCGYHYASFAVEPGRRLYRWKVNQLLGRFRVPLRLADEGELRGRLIETTDEAREDLIDRAKSSADSDDVGTIEHAVALFRRRGATREDKRSAINSLHRVFEQHRDLMKVELLSKDESDLFHIANKFDLRHNDAKQQPNYEEAYLDWVFWWYLGTVELVQQLVSAQRLTKSTP